MPSPQWSRRSKCSIPKTLCRSVLGALARSHKDRAVASNNSLQAGNTRQRAGHAAAVIQFSNAFVLEVAKAPFKRFSNTLIHLSEDPDAPCVGVLSIFV